MNKTILWALALSLVASGSAPMWAAPGASSGSGRMRMGGPGGPEGRGGSGRGMRNEPKMKLERLWRGVGELSGANAVSKSQARSMVALVRPWTSKPTMTDAQATALVSRLGAVLTPAQKSALDKMRPGGPGGMGGRGPGGPGERDGRGGPPPGRMGGGMGGPPPGGFGGRDGGPPGGFDRSKMDAMRKAMNPFYAPSKSAQSKSMPDFMQRGMARRYEESRRTLDALARKAA